MIFRVVCTRFEFESGDWSEVRPPAELNSFRGAMGAALRERNRSLYETWFSPRWPEGPSGYRDAPRPFVLRRTVSGIDLILFQTAEPVDEIEAAMQTAICRVTGQRVRREEPIALELPVEANGGRGILRLAFTTPIEIKSRGIILAKPDFFSVFELLAERVRILGRLYQAWPAEVNFHLHLEIAKQVETLDFSWTHADSQRQSARNRQIHSIGGFMGWARYTGPLGALLPLLEIGRWTGVGRQTVWGKGEIRVESFTAEE